MYPENLTYFFEPNIANHKSFKIRKLKYVKETDIQFILVGHEQFKELEMANPFSFVNL